MNELSFKNVSENHLDRNFFQETNENILEVKHCIQDLYWDGYNVRDESFKRRLALHKGFRNINFIPPAEIVLREQFHVKKPQDIFFQFKNTITNLKLNITHFQVRKNFHLIDNKELVYSKKMGIESLNLITKKKQTLCVLSALDEMYESRSIICFDVWKRKSEGYLLCTGTFEGSVSLFKISQDEIDRIKEFKSDVVPKFNNYLTKTISFGNSEEILTNYVKFLQKDQNPAGLEMLLTTNNDGCVRLFDLNNNLNKVMEFKGSAAINHCSFNDRCSQLACIGDSQNIEIFDYKSFQKIENFRGHNDFGTVIKWKPGSDYVFATGNQDFSCKLWDMRKLMQPLKYLHGYFDSVGDLLFIGEEYLVYGENTDYLHIYNMKTDTVQTMNYLGQFAGLAYNKKVDELYLAVEDSQSSQILTYNKIQNYQNLNNINF
jgi:WD40 repeat protein